MPSRILMYTGTVFTLSVILTFALLHKNTGMTEAEEEGLKKPNSFVDYSSRNSNDMTYGVVIDAGSSGSRLFIYMWPPHSGKPTDLIKIEPLRDEAGNPVVKKISPGLSSYGTYPDGAVEHIFALLNYSRTQIPEPKLKETTLFILATAGLRLIPKEQSNVILETLRDEIPKHYPFILMDSHVEIISGKWEGIYSWIAVNYALGNFDFPNDAQIDSGNKSLLLARKPTVGMIDMGGGSVQITFETKQTIPRLHEHLTQEVNLGFKEEDSFRKYKVYATTFLGFGANSAIESYENWLSDQLQHSESHVTMSDSSFNESTTSSTVSTINDPCLPPYLLKKVTDTRFNRSFEFVRRGSGDFGQCLANLKLLLKSDTCPSSMVMCSINGVYQPAVNFSLMKIFGFSEYYYTADDIFRLGGAYFYEKFIKAASDFCATKWTILNQRFIRKWYPKADKTRMKTQCFKSAWIHAVLHDGFKVPKNTTNFHAVSVINGQEVQWTLGALLYRLRHFPLRELQRLREMQIPAPRFRQANGQRGFWWWSSLSFSRLSLDCQILIILCSSVLIVILIKCLNRWRRFKRVASSLLIR